MSRAPAFRDRLPRSVPAALYTSPGPLHRGRRVARRQRVQKMLAHTGGRQALPWQRLRAWLGAAVLLAGLAAPAAAADPAAVDDHAELVIGRTSDDPRSDVGRLQPLLDYVVPRMAGVGIRRGRVLMARDTQQMISYLRRGKVDWLTDTAGAAMAFEERAGARIMLTSYREGVDRYASVLVARRDRGIESIDDLRGRSIAFQNASSTSAYFLPASAILQHGLPLVILASPADRPGSDLVGFVFARTELNIATWVHKGLADAGAFSNLDWDNPRRMPPSFRADFRVIAESDSVPRAIELIRKDLPAELADVLRATLLGLDNKPEAQEALRGYFATARFEAIDAETQRSLTALNARIAPLRKELDR